MTMTIDEFMGTIAPKMRKGWVAMDADKDWYFHPTEPFIVNDWWSSSDEIWLIRIFDIAPVEDWRRSLRKVG